MTGTLIMKKERQAPWEDGEKEVKLTKVSSCDGLKDAGISSCILAYFLLPSLLMMAFDADIEIVIPDVVVSKLLQFIQ